MHRLAIALALAGGSATGCSFIFDLPSVALPIPDASPDALAAIDDAGLIVVAPPFCSSRTAPSLFCEDFDAIVAPAIITLGAPTAKSGRVAVEATVGLSTPRGLLVTANGDSSSAAITRPIGPTPLGITVSFDLLVATWQTPRAQLAQITVVEGATSCVVRLVGSATTWSVSQDCTANAKTKTITTETTRTIEPGRWQRFTLAVRVDPTPTVTLDIGDARVVDVPALESIKSTSTNATFGIELAQSGTIVLFQDNLLVTSP